MSEENIYKCPNVTTTTISYRMSVSDLPAGVTLDAFYNDQIVGLGLYPPGTTSSSVYEAKTFTIGSKNQLNPFKLQPSIKNNSWFIIASQLSGFDFDLSRLCDVSFTPNATSNITYIDISGTITDKISNNKDLPNDKLSSACLGQWIGKWLTDYTQTNQDIPPLSSTPAANDPICKINTFTSNVVPENFTNNSFLDKMNFKITNVNVSNNFEEYTGVTVTTKKVDTETKMSLDFIFAYTYLFAFVGAIFFSVSSVINVDIYSIIANKNAVVFLNVFTGLCGLIGIFNWYNSDVPVIGNFILPNGKKIIKIKN